MGSLIQTSLNASSLMASVFQVQEIVPVQTERTVHMETMDHRNPSPQRNQKSRIDQAIILQRNPKNQKHLNITIGQRKHHDNQNQTTINQLDRRNLQITTNRPDRRNQKNLRTTTNRTKSQTRNHPTTINPIKNQTKSRQIIISPTRNPTISPINITSQANRTRNHQITINQIRNQIKSPISTANQIRNHQTIT